MFCISVSIYYHDVSAAEAACNSLNGIVLDNHSEDYEVPLIVTLISSKSRKSVLDSALKIMWFKPSVAAHVILDASEYDASDIIRSIRDCFLGGRYLECEDSSSNTVSSIFIKNLHPNTTTGAIIKLFKMKHLHHVIDFDSRVPIKIHGPCFRNEQAKSLILTALEQHVHPMEPQCSIQLDKHIIASFIETVDNEIYPSTAHATSQRL